MDKVVYNVTVASSVESGMLRLLVSFHEGNLRLLNIRLFQVSEQCARGLSYQDAKKFLLYYV